MCEFKNGDQIEYENGPNEWVRGTYIGHYPIGEGRHVICNTGGVLMHGKEIRKPKVKKEGWVSIYPSLAAGNIFETQKLALANRGQMAVATIKIEWEA